MHIAAGEEQLSLRRRSLAAAAADHDLAVGDHIGDAGQIAVADGVGDAGAGRTLDRPADDQVRRTARRQDADVEAVGFRRVAGGDGDGFRWRYAADRGDVADVDSMPRGMTPVPPGVSVPSVSRASWPLARIRSTARLVEP